MGIALLVIGGGIYALFYSTKGAHLELTGKIIKARTGALDEDHSIAVLDFRLANASDVRFVVRQVWVTLEKADGSKLRGDLASKSDITPVFQYNKFLGVQYNEALSIKDEVKPHGELDRMVAASFPLPETELEKGKSLDLWIQDLDGVEFETVYKLK